MNCDFLKQETDDEYFEPFKERYDGMDKELVVKFISVIRGCVHILMSMERYFHNEGLSKTRFHMLVELLRHPEEGVNPKTLSCKCHISSATVTGLIDTLEKDGLVERVPDTRDRRRISVRLTGKGFDFLDDFLPRHQQNIGAMIEEFKDDEIWQMISLLSKMHQGVEKQISIISRKKDQAVKTKLQD